MPPTPTPTLATAAAAPSWRPADEHDFAWDVDADLLRALLQAP